MNARDAGRRGGQRSSPAKRAAARANGARGGRPKNAEVLVQRMHAIHAELAKHHLDIDPHDLDLIIERMCRQPGSGRRFFIRPLRGGGYGV